MSLNFPPINYPSRGILLKGVNNKEEPKSITKVASMLAIKVQ